jgi:hypothetical protein
MGPILCLASSKILTPHPLCVCVCLCCAGRTHSPGGEGVGGQYFGRRKTRLCTLPVSNPLWMTGRTLAPRGEKGGRVKTTENKRHWLHWYNSIPAPLTGSTPLCLQLPVLSASAFCPLPASAIRLLFSTLSPMYFKEQELYLPSYFAIYLWKWLRNSLLWGND